MKLATPFRCYHLKTIITPKCTSKSQESNKIIVFSTPPLSELVALCHMHTPFYATAVHGFCDTLPIATSGNINQWRFSECLLELIYSSRNGASPWSNW